MNSNIEQAISECINTLEENHIMKNNCRVSFDAVINRQVEVFVEHGQKIAPIISFLKERGYSFYNKDLDCHSMDGPVIAFDGKKIFTFNGNGLLVDTYDIYSKETKVVHMDNFFRTHSFKQAMYGLLSVVKLQDTVISDYRDLIDKAESELREFDNSY